MENIISDKDKILENYTDAVIVNFKKIRYGISTCLNIKDLNTIRFFKKIVEWQCKLEYNIIDNTDITIISDLPGFQNNRPFIIGGLQQEHTATVNFEYDQDGSSVEIDSDGCKTTLIVNTAPCPNPRQAMTYLQGTSATVWTIVHNLGFIPNVRTEDLSGNDIDGIIEVININTIQITFSSSVTGRAYLS